MFEGLLQVLLNYKAGFDIDTLTANNQYIPLNVEDCISKFMINDFPDEGLFRQFANQLMVRAQKHKAKVRVFSEIGGTLHPRGQLNAVLQLEQLWHSLHQEEPFCLFCAYPQIRYTAEDEAPIVNICKIHSKIIDGSARPSTEVWYRNS